MMMNMTPKKNGINGGTASRSRAVGSVVPYLVAISVNYLYPRTQNDVKKDTLQSYDTAATDTSKPYGVHLTQGVGAVCCGMAS
jgi:hypothetical protein